MCPQNNYRKKSFHDTQDNIRSTVYFYINQVDHYLCFETGYTETKEDLYLHILGKIGMKREGKYINILFLICSHRNKMT